MNKKSFILSFSLAAVIACVGIAKAADETAESDGNVTNSLIGTFHTSSGTGRSGETRRIAVDDNGSIMTVPGKTETFRSTGSRTSNAGIFAIGNTTNTFTVSASSWIGAVGCRGIQDNCNVIKLATIANPYFIESIAVGDAVGGAPGVDAISASNGRTTIRLFDSRGSTATAYHVWSTNVSSGAVVPVGVWVSSGATVAKDTLADFTIIGRSAR